MPDTWCDRLLDSHSLAFLAAAGVALMAFPGADLVRLARAEPPPLAAPFDSKGPETRLTGKPASISQKEDSGSTPPTSETASEPKPAPARPARDRDGSREFEGCLETYPEKACRRAFDAVVERYAREKAHGADVVARASLQPLAFDEQPLWVRRLESLAEDGVALKRVRTGGGHEWVFGITREGVVGFSFEERRGD
jgi:hypothetical protein